MGRGDGLEQRNMGDHASVSYTHLDVYKRQELKIDVPGTGIVFLIPLITDWMARFCGDTPCMVSLVVITGRTINLIPSKNVIKTEKFHIVVDGTRLET